MLLLLLYKRICLSDSEQKFALRTMLHLAASDHRLQHFEDGLLSIALHHTIKKKNIGNLKHVF